MSMKSICLRNFNLGVGDPRRRWLVDSGLEVQVLKSHGNKSRRRNDKGPQDMEIDCIKNVTTDLSAKACQTKDVLTEVDHPLSSAKTSESCLSDSPLRLRYLQFHMFL